MSLTSSRPLPELPLETQAHMLRHCDVPTLAVSSRVCLAWLELSGPILYEHITIRGKEQLEMMIRSETVLASIAPFVSLDQTNSFTYIFNAATALADMDVSVRLAASPVSVGELVIDLREGTTDDSVRVQLDVLLASFNPCHIHICASPAHWFRMGVILDLPPELEWPHLRKMTFTHAFLVGHLVDRPALVDRAPPLELAYDLSCRPSEESDQDFEETLDFVWEDLCRDREFEGTKSPAAGHVQVWVRDEDEVAIAKTWLINCSCTSLDIGVKKPADA